MKRHFVSALTDLVNEDPDVFLLTLDVGFGVLEPFIERHPKNFLNMGIGEQNAVSFATGMAIGGKIPFVYSINSFLLFRALEQIKFLSHMKQHVVLVGVGLDKEYSPAGISHYSSEDLDILKTMPIKVWTPQANEEVKKIVHETYKERNPHYIRLSRH